MILKSYTSRIRLKTECGELERYFRTKSVPHAIFPDFSTEDSGTAGFTVSYKDREANYAKLDKKNRRISISGRYKKGIPPEQLVWVNMPIFEFLNEEQGLFGLHAAAIVKDDKAMLLMGKGYTGKTTLAMDLSMNRGYKFMGDERILLDGATSRVVAGNSMLSPRTDMIHKMFRSVERSMGLKYDKNDPKQIFVRPSDVGIKCADKPADITKIIFTNIVPNGRKAKFHEKKNIDAKIELLQNISYYIRGVGSCIAHCMYALPSLDNSKLTDARMKSIVRLVDKEDVTVYKAYGSFKSIADFLENVEL